MGLWAMSQVTLGSDGEWRQGDLTTPQVERLFGIRVGSSSVSSFHRRLGFQDPYEQVLLKLTSTEAFLQVSGLALGGPPTISLDDATQQLSACCSPGGVRSARQLTGVSDQLNPTSGAVEWSRSAVLIEYDDQQWVFLTALGP